MSFNIRHSEHLFTITLLLAATIIFLCGSRWGLAFCGNDSLGYYEMAQLALKGEGIYQKVSTSLVEPATHWSPGYPYFVAFIQKITQQDLLKTFQYTNLFLLLTNILLFQKLAKKILKTNPDALIATLLFALHHSTIDCHLELISEGFFTFLYLTTLLSLHNYETTTQNKYWYTAAITLSIATFTRYAAIILPLPILLYFTIFSKKKPTFAQIIQFILLFSIFPILLFIRNQLYFHESTDRIFALHPIDLHKFIQLGQTITGWFSPLIYIKNIKPIAAAIGFLGIAFFIKNLHSQYKKGAQTQKQEPHFSKLFTLITIFYLSFLAISISFFDYFTDLDYRILYPIFPLFLISIFQIFSTFDFPKTQKSILIVFLLSTYIFHALTYTQNRYKNGDNCTLSPKFRNDTALNNLAQTYSDKKIYSNIPDVLKMYGAKNAIFAPTIINPSSRQKNNQLEQEIDLMLKEYKEQKAIFIFLRNTLTKPILVSEDQIIQKTNLKPDTLSENILIYR